MLQKFYTLIGLMCALGGLVSVSWGQEIRSELVPTSAQLQGMDFEHFEIPPTDDGLPGVGPIRRYDWFESLWKNRRHQWAKDSQEDQGAVVFLGDSITQGWGDDMDRAFGEMKVANRGISGDTTRGMLIRLAEDVLALHPKAVVILAGTNDLEEKATPDQAAANMAEIIHRLHSFDQEMPIVLCQVFPSSASKARPKEKIQATNRLYNEAVKGLEYVTVIDTWKLFADAQGDAPVDEFPDLLHPNEKGYHKWKMALVPYLETLGLTSVETNQQIETPADFVSLFNGRDLTGWSYQPSTEEDRRTHEGWKAADPNAPQWPLLTEAVSHSGEKETPDQRYRARHGRLVVCYPPEGRKIQQIWTDQVFSGDFTLRLEFRAMPDADSGVFVCGRQLQCRDFLRAGPYNQLKKFNDLGWNSLEIVVKNGFARCTCNDELLEEKWEVPPSGRIGLEADRGQIEYRAILLRHDGN